MRPAVLGLLLTAPLLVIVLLLPEELSSTWQRLVGAGCGASAALAVVALGGCKRHSMCPGEEFLVSALAPRFFRERRRAPRHSVRLPVRVRANGQTCFATLLNVSAEGALLRLHPSPDQEFRARVGDHVKIHNYPAGTVVRVGGQGLYLDFSVQFDRATAPSSESHREAESTESLLSSIGRS